VTMDEIGYSRDFRRELIKLIHEKYGLSDQEDDITDDNAVLISTMHSAKGLEADFVLIMYLNDNFIPAAGRDTEEERRVLYVAMTRAKQDVILLFHERYDPDRRRRLRLESMSRFLRDISENLNICGIATNDIETFLND